MSENLYPDVPSSFNDVTFFQGVLPGIGFVKNVVNRNVRQMIVFSSRWAPC